MTENQLSSLIVQACFDVHSELGPGLLESTYEKCLVYELRNEMGLLVEEQVEIPINYKGLQIESAFRLDIWVEKKVIIEVKSVKELSDIHMAQIITYLKLTDNRLGFLVNFNETLVKYGIRRVVNKFIE
jgi:GxxExxY protein